MNTPQTECNGYADTECMRYTKNGMVACFCGTMRAALHAALFHKLRRETFGQALGGGLALRPSSGC